MAAAVERMYFDAAVRTGSGSETVGKTAVWIEAGYSEFEQRAPRQIAVVLTFFNTFLHTYSAQCGVMTQSMRAWNSTYRRMQSRCIPVDAEVVETR